MAPYRRANVSRISASLKAGITTVNLSSVIGQMGNAGQGAYAAAKAGLIGFTKSMARELASRGVRANALHPGGIRTELGRHLTREAIQEMTDRFALRGGAPQFKDVAHGAATQVWAAVAPELEGVGGRYLEDVSIGEPAAHAVDPAIAARLWTLSEKLVGESFPL